MGYLEINQQKSKANQDHGISKSPRSHNYHFPLPQAANATVDHRQANLLFGIHGYVKNLWKSWFQGFERWMTDPKLCTIFISQIGLAASVTILCQFVTFTFKMFRWICWRHISAEHTIYLFRLLWSINVGRVEGDPLAAWQTNEGTQWDQKATEVIDWYEILTERIHSIIFVYDEKQHVVHKLILGYSV